MGFMREWKLGPAGRFSGKTIVQFSDHALHIIGLLWLLACILMLFSGFAYYLRIEWWWMTAAGGLIVSQTLIILYWPDAKWGTIFNVLLLFIIFTSAGS